jgi:16S rRNA G527 N7-methylase RsmG
MRTLKAVTNETNRELATSRAAVINGQASAEVLLDRALASIEHLSEVAQTMARWMDGVISECLSAAV